MTAHEKAGNRAMWLAEDAAKARSQSRDMAARVLQLAGKVAATEDEVAETLSHLARSQPRYAARLRMMISAARGQAAYERQWAHDHALARQPSTGHHDDPS